MVESKFCDICFQCKLLAHGILRMICGKKCYLAKLHYALELRQNKNDSMDSISMFVLKLPGLFTRLYREEQSKAIFKQTYSWTPSSRSYIVFALGFQIFMKHWQNFLGQYLQLDFLFLEMKFFPAKLDKEAYILSSRSEK